MRGVAGAGVGCVFGMGLENTKKFVIKKLVLRLLYGMKCIELVIRDKVRGRGLGRGREIQTIFEKKTNCVKTVVWNEMYLNW